jgi:TonB family protein
MIQAIAIYLLKMIFCSAVMVTYYWVALRNKRFHYYNRFYLLLSAIISILIPLCNLQLLTFKSNNEQVIRMFNVIYAGSGEAEVIAHSKNLFNWEMWLAMLLLIVCLCSLLSLAYRIIKIYSFKKYYPVSKMKDFDFINTDLQQAPFSFLKNIFWRKDISLEETTGRQILEHELTHIKEKHSWDKLFMQIVLSFFWINPFFWLIKTELCFIHEFIADEKAVENKDVSAFAAMLLHAQYGKAIFSPAQSFFYSPIKRRLIMLTTSKESRFSYARRIITLPLLTFVILLFAFRLQKQNVVTMAHTVNAFKLVVDAGHGGKDDGAIGMNGAKEKDFSLIISKKIKEMSPQYGIDVVLSRDNDVFMSPSEKVDFAKAQNADAFISIHANSKTTEDGSEKKSGIEVCISGDNAEYEKSKVLGSAVLQTVNKNFHVNPSLIQRKVGIWVLKANTLPSILIECGYLDNVEDLNVLNDAAKVELMAREILQGVAMYANHNTEGSKLSSIQFEGSESYSREAKFPGGAEPWQKYLEKNVNLNVLTDKKAPPGSYTVVVTFLVDNNGNVSEVKALNDPGYGAADEAVRVIANSGKWIPATQNGKYVTHRQKQSITFRIDESKKNTTLNSNNALDAGSNISQDSNFVKAGFPGGHDAWEKFLEKNLNSTIPVDKGSPPGTYKVIVAFLVDANGKVSKVKAMKNPGYGTAEEAVRIIVKGPDWIPAKKNNSPVSSMVKQDITFQVSEQ